MPCEPAAGISAAIAVFVSFAGRYVTANPAAWTLQLASAQVLPIDTGPSLSSKSLWIGHVDFSLLLTTDNRPGGFAALSAILAERFTSTGRRGSDFEDAAEELYDTVALAHEATQELYNTVALPNEVDFHT